MILVDSSVWIGHFKKSNPALSALLSSRLVSCHPFVVGELALGGLSRRDEVLGALQALPSISIVPHDEVLAFVNRYGLHAQGIGWIDVHLLASALVNAQVSLWTHDRRLERVATSIGIAYSPTLGV